MDQLLPFAIWIPSLPILFICIAGIVLAAKKLPPHRRALRFAQVGFSALILRTIVAVSSQMMAMQAREAHDSAAGLAGKLVAANTASYLLMLAGILFLAMAILADRTVMPAHTG
jgi:hypothetical protein